MAEEGRLMRAAEEREGDVIYVVEATLLIEAGGRERYDKIVVVDVDPETQMSRGVARGMDAGDVASRIRHQMAREERLRHADYVIDNSHDEGAALAEVTRVYEALVADLRAKKSAPKR
jgi:dephospho-CoA kinase